MDRIRPESKNRKGPRVPRRSVRRDPIGNGVRLRPGLLGSPFLGASLWVLLLVSGSFFGCAYYNTFYFAKKHYSAAEKLVRQAGSDKLPPEAVRRYDSAIQQCGKVLKFHGGSRWVDDALYLMGASFYGKRDYDEALRKFDELVANYSESPFVPWALYKSGLCHYELGSHGLMDTYFQRVLEGYPRFERRDEILFTYGRAAEQMRDRTEAIRRYRVLVRQYPKGRSGNEALLRIGDLYFDAGHADSAYASYDEMARLARDEETWRRAQLKAADALVRLNREAEAIEILEGIRPKDDAQIRPGDDFSAQIRVHYAQALNAQGEHERALEELRLVTKRHAGSSFAAEAQFQIGYTYEVYLDSLDAARAAYDEVGRVGATSVFKDQAQSRSRSLQQLQSLTREATSDSLTGTEKQAEAALRLAELYLFSQNKVPEALRAYEEVLARYPESRIAPRAAYAIAWIRLKRVEGARDSALAGFTDLVRVYPASQAARGAIDLLAAEGVDTTGLAALLMEPTPEPVAPEPEVPDTSAPSGRLVSPVPAEGDSGTGVLTFPAGPPAAGEEFERADEPGRKPRPGELPPLIREDAPSPPGGEPADSLRRPGRER